MCGVQSPSSNLFVIGSCLPSRFLPWLASRLASRLLTFRLNTSAHRFLYMAVLHKLRDSSKAALISCGAWIKLFCCCCLEWQQLQHSSEFRSAESKLGVCRSRRTQRAQGLLFKDVKQMLFDEHDSSARGFESVFVSDTWAVTQHVKCSC